MSPGLRRPLGIAVAIVVTMATVALSRVPYGDSDAGAATLRITWRAPGERVEECRTLSAEELEALPVHMRRERICERRFLPYRLQVDLDGRRVIDEVVRPAGAQEDRPLYVFRELDLEPGSHRVEVRWAREDGLERTSEGTTGTGPLSLEASLRLEPGDVALVTYDPVRRILATAGRGVHRSSSESPPENIP
jgi:hypothetical protein